MPENEETGEHDYLHADEFNPDDSWIYQPGCTCLLCVALRQVWAAAATPVELMPDEEEYHVWPREPVK